MHRLKPGFVLGERYTLDSWIASGGMADVWEAKDSVLSRQVALKIMRSTTLDETDLARRFRAEALNAAALSHVNIATVFDYGEDDGLAFLVMERVPGKPLSTVLREQGSLPPEQVRSILGQAALALSVAHEHQVVHRDVKPANILLTPDGVVKLTDFGIARSNNSEGHTKPGEVLGTPHYLSPEQAVGNDATGASDLYALGVVGHEMLTGHRPFDKNTPVATALAQVQEPPPPLPDSVPDDLRTLIMQCLAKQPANRPHSALDVAKLLGAVSKTSEIEDETAVNVVDSDALAAHGTDAEELADVVDPSSPPTEPAAVVPEPEVPYQPQRALEPVPDATAATPTPRRSGRLQVAGRGIHWAWIPAGVAIGVMAVLLWQWIF